MIIYKDKFTGDELFTDAYKVDEEKAFYRFTGKLTTRKVGEIDGSLIGANASAEEAQEQTVVESTSGLDFALTARMNELSFDKASFQVYMKAYFKKLQDKCVPPCGEGEDAGEQESKVKEFQARAKEFTVFIMKKFKDLCFYFGENDVAGEHGCCFVIWRDDSEVDVYIFKDSVEQEKY